MIKDIGGRNRSERTSKELAGLLRDEFERLSPEEREAFLLMVRELNDPAMTPNIATEGGPVKIYDALTDSEYLRPMVDIETFVKDPYYLGATCENLYPRLLNDLKEIFSGGYKEVVITGAIGTGKCLKGNNFFVECETGRRYDVESAVGSTPTVPSLIDDSIKTTTASKIWKSGVKECARLTLASGQWLEASFDHPVLTPFGYKNIGDLTERDLVAVARRVPAPRVPIDVSDAEVKTVAMLMADGCMMNGNTSYCKCDKNLCELFKSAVCEMPGFGGFREEYKKGAYYVFVDGIRPWTDSLGLRVLSKDKRVPDHYFGLNDRQLAIFLNLIFTDSTVNSSGSRGIDLCLASERLIDDVQFLLRRFGICARKYYKKASIKDDDGNVRLYDAWRLTISDAPTKILFFETIGLIKGKEDVCRASLEHALSVIPNTDWDVVPITNIELKEIHRDTGPYKKHEWRKMAGLSSGSCMSSERFIKLCEKTGYSGRFKRFADQKDLVWERVLSINNIGQHDVYDLTVPGSHNAVVNGLVVHNTYVASIAICRCLYEISCLRNPHRTFGIAPGTTIAFVVLSVSEQLAMKVAFENIVTKLKASPYFQEHFDFEPTKHEIRFPGNVWVAPRAATDTSTLGLNVIGVVLDELNFFESIARVKATAEGKDKAQVLYDQLNRRIKSRFMRGGKLPGLMLLVSSKRTRDDFTAKRIREAKDDPSVYVMDYSLYDVKPDAYSSEKFHVLVGNETTPSRILHEDEVETVRSNIGAQDNLIIIDVPVDFYEDFQRDIEGGIRDISGIETVSISPFIPQRDKIMGCVETGPHARKHPFSVVEWDQSEGGDFIWDRLIKRTKIRDGAELIDAWQPLHYPGMPRHVHIDPSINSDATGFCCGCVIGQRTIQRRNKETGELYTEQSPVIWIDLMLRIKPPLGGEIDQSKVRGLVHQLRTHGFPVGYISMDQFNSLSSLQIFHSQGIEAERISVDKPMDAYDSLKAAIYEGRLVMYEYEPLLRELRSLQHDRVKNKIDHSRESTKDISDALAGVVFSLTTKYRGVPLGIMKGVSQYNDQETEAQTKAVEREDFMMPFLVG